MAYRKVGVTDDFDQCDQCGKCNLKKVVILETDEGFIRYMGVDCAARALGRSERGIRQYMRDAERAAPEQIRRATGWRNSDKRYLYRTMLVPTSGIELNEAEAEFDRTITRVSEETSWSPRMVEEVLWDELERFA